MKTRTAVNGTPQQISDFTFDFYLGVNVTQRHVAQYPLHHLTYAPANVLSCYVQWFRRCIYKKIYIIWPWPCKYPAHYNDLCICKVLTYNCLVDEFTRKHIIWPWPWGQCHTKCCPVPTTSCDLCILLLLLLLFGYCVGVPRSLRTRHIHWNEVISSHHTIFAPVQKIKITLTKFKFY